MRKSFCLNELTGLPARVCNLSTRSCGSHPNSVLYIGAVSRMGFPVSFSIRTLTLAALLAANVAVANEKIPAPSRPQSASSASAEGSSDGCSIPSLPETKALREFLRSPWMETAFPSSSGQNTPQASKETPDVTIKSVVLNLPKDQLAIWTSPFHARRRDLTWLLPLAVTSGLLIGSDSHSMAREQSNAVAVHRSTQISNYGVAALLSVPALTYLAGQWNGSSRARETGLLAGEAAVNSFIVNEVVKLTVGRERPTLTDGRGRFFTQFGNSSSFPSEHAMLAWSVASVVAHEYPGPLSQLVVYAAATAVSLSRVTARQHFPSDVVVGAAMGWLIGRQMYRAHSTNRDDEDYGASEHDPESSGGPPGSIFVPLDSWIYPALKRLASLGYIPTQFAAMQPWTKRECVRQLGEAEDLAQDLPPEADVRQLINSLKKELGAGSDYDHSAQIESVYTRYMNISGVPLRDTYHFGQTISNDFGRPYDQGNNFIAGATASAVAGRFFFYVQGEYEHAPGRPALSATQQNLVNSLDGNVGPLPNPIGPQPAPVAQIDRFYPLDMYAGVQLGGYAVTFGKQSLWLGPGESPPLMLSDNADPMYMLRLAHTSPFYLPWIFRYLGPVEDEYLFSKLSGHQFPARPFFNLQKISFHPTRNLEIGFTRASLWAGVGHPFTLHSLERNFLALGDTPAGPFNSPNDIGDRKSGFDFSYRLPGLRNWLTIYCDSYSDDDPSPIANPRRAAVSPGVYLSRVPGIPKLDLRLEAVSTQSLTATDRSGQFLYWNLRYHDSNTNKGFLFGNSTGRDGRALQGWSTYHFAPGKTLEFSYRQIKVGNGFLPGGGTQSDAVTKFAWRLNPEWTVDSFLQYERWLIPSLLPTEQRNFSTSIQVTFHPHWQIHQR